MAHLENPLAAAALVAVVAWLGLAGLAAARGGSSERRVATLVLPLALAGACLIPPAVAAVAGSGDRATASADSQLSYAAIGAFLFVAAVALAGAAVSRVRMRVAHPGLFAAVLSLWGMGIVANLSNGLPSPRLSAFLVPPALFVAMTVFPSGASMQRSLRLAALSVCYASLVVAILFPDRAFFSESRVIKRVLPERLAGITPHPNFLALVAASALVLVAARPRRIGLLHGPVALAVLIATDSRGTWIGAIVAVAAVIGARLSAGVRERLGIRLLVVVAGGVILAVKLVGAYGTSAGETATLDGRTGLWNVAVSEWHKSPLLGRGIGLWQRLMQEGVVPTTAGQAHNEVFEVLSTTGLVGLGVLIVIVGLWVRAALRDLRRGVVEPVALLLLFACYSSFESSIRIWALDPTCWIFFAFVLCAQGRVAALPSVATTRAPMRAPMPVEAT